MKAAVFRRIWIGAIVVLIAAIVVTSLAPQQLVAVESFSDKVGHYLAYFTLALAVSGISTQERLRRHLLACFLLGAALEVAQALLTVQRSAEWADLAANGAGIATAWLITARGRAGWALRAWAGPARRG